MTRTRKRQVQMHKDTCMRCIERSSVFSKEAVSLYGLYWDKKRAVHCISENSWISIKEFPPENCPHKLQHAVYVGKKNDTR